MKSKSKRRKGLKAKKYNLGGYLDPNGDPTKKPGQAVAESTAVPNYAEQAFLNYAGLLPQLQTPFFRDEGTIRPTPENEPDFLQRLYGDINIPTRSGLINLGMTEDEKFAPPDQMSLLDVMAEPLKALEYYSFDANRGKLPTRAEWDAFGSPNPMDMPLAMYNPAAQIAFAQEDEAGGLSAITGIGKIGNVVRDAFNIGDDYLRIAAEDISKQGKKMTQRQLAQQINKSPVVDLEEAIYNTDLYGVKTPGFGNRASTFHYLGESSSPLSKQLQAYHANEYNIGTEEFSLRSQDIFNRSYDGYSLPITRSVGYSGTSENVSDVSIPLYDYGAYGMASIPQIKSLQRGGELEKFVKKDGTINTKEVLGYVNNSNAISPADKFIINQAVRAHGIPSQANIDYGQFKRAVSEFVPRMATHTESRYSDYGAGNVFPQHVLEPTDSNYNPNLQMDSRVVVLSESNLPKKVESEAGAEMDNYLLNGRGRHYAQLEMADGTALGNHSHYRVARLSDEPEVSYFLEIQSDGLSPMGNSLYSIADRDAKDAAALYSKPDFQEYDYNGWMQDPDPIYIDGEPANLIRNDRGHTFLEAIGSDMNLSTAQWSTRFDRFLEELVLENPKTFESIIGIDVSGIDESKLNSFFDQNIALIRNKIRTNMSPEQYRELYKNSIEPKVIKKHSFTLSPEYGREGKSELTYYMEGILDRMNNIINRYDGDSELYSRVLRGEVPESYVLDDLKQDYARVSRLFDRMFEPVDEAFRFIDGKQSELGLFRTEMGMFFDSYGDAMNNSILMGKQIPREDVKKLEDIKNEVTEIYQQVLKVSNDYLKMRRYLKEVRSALDVNADLAFPIDTEKIEIDSYFNDVLKKIGPAIYDAMRAQSFEELMENTPDMFELVKRFNTLVDQYKKEIKIFGEKHVNEIKSPYTLWTFRTS